MAGGRSLPVNCLSRMLLNSTAQASVFDYRCRTTLSSVRSMRTIGHCCKKYHRPCNSVIVTNDDLARWIQQDFPNYQVDASVIKNIKTHQKIDEALKLYDSIVLPMSLNEDLEFLEKIEAKDRITLFANAGCALTCTSKLCYRSLSIDQQR